MYRTSRIPVMPDTLLPPVGGSNEPVIPIEHQEDHDCELDQSTPVPSVIEAPLPRTEALILKDNPSPSPSRLEQRLRELSNGTKARQEAYRRSGSSSISQTSNIKTPFHATPKPSASPIRTNDTIPTESTIPPPKPAEEVIQSLVSPADVSTSRSTPEMSSHSAGRPQVNQDGSTPTQPRHREERDEYKPPTPDIRPDHPMSENHEKESKSSQEMSRVNKPGINNIQSPGNGPNGKSPSLSSHSFVDTFVERVGKFLAQYVYPISLVDWHDVPCA